MAAAARTGVMPSPAMAGSVVPAEERNAQMANLAEQANRAQAVLNSRGATPAQMSDARAALRDVRTKMKELSSTFTPEAARLQTLPDVLNSVVKATEAAASPLSSIDRLSIIGGSADAQAGIAGLLGVSPLAVANIVEALKSSGIDLAALLGRPSNPEPGPAD